MSSVVGMRKIAHYYYDDGKELQVFVQCRRFFIRDQDGELPFDPEFRYRHPYPGDGTELGDTSYETLGLYYDYGMSGTGWGDDC